MTNLIATVTREENTFKFFVNTEESHKIVTIEQHTDFTGTCLEEDFPNGDTSIWTVSAPLRLSDKEAVNFAGSKLLTEWQII